MNTSCVSHTPYQYAPKGCVLIGCGLYSCVAGQNCDAVLIYEYMKCWSVTGRLIGCQSSEYRNGCFYFQRSNVVGDYQWVVLILGV